MSNSSPSLFEQIQNLPAQLQGEVCKGLRDFDSTIRKLGKDTSFEPLCNMMGDNARSLSAYIVKSLGPPAVVQEHSSKLSM